ncbi:MAG: phenylacetic acid degradation operon negative regulatory protein PaaX [Zoogloeaceae bacterium]|nr:phenylacetic acid degradation operon negative regulatory protein PaaX [Zoogloeaceae bacterium]
MSPWIERTLRETPLRANSLIITLYGDAILPHGGAALLGSLIKLISPLGIKERAVRTSVFRLVQEGWLEATPIGRRSEYRLTDIGRSRIHHAYHRIYDTPDKPWNGQWQIAIIPEGKLPPDKREALRSDLQWDGYGTIAPGVLAQPSDDTQRLHEILKQTESNDSVLMMSAQTQDGIAGKALQAMVQQCWKLDQLAENYERFIEHFKPVKAWLSENKTQNPEQHFVIRTLLIHEFRRVQLRDPQLPERLLTKKWPGNAARALCRELYKQLLPLSEQHLASTMETANGILPEADTSLQLRFGGNSHQT